MKFMPKYFWRIGIASLVIFALVQAVPVRITAVMENERTEVHIQNCDPEDKSLKIKLSPRIPQPGDVLNITLQITPKFDVLSATYAVNVQLNDNPVYKSSGVACNILSIYICGLQANKTYTFVKNDLLIPHLEGGNWKGTLHFFNQDEESLFCFTIYTTTASKEQEGSSA